MFYRTLARKWAFQYIYQKEIKQTFDNKNKDEKQFLQYLEEYKRMLIEQPKLIEQAETFFNELSSGMKEKKQQIDELIKKHSSNWNLSRISHIDLSILRLSIYEGYFLKQSPAIIISEALKIATKFSGKKSIQFINGLLNNALNNNLT